MGLLASCERTLNRSKALVSFWSKMVISRWISLHLTQRCQIGRALSSSRNSRMSRKTLRDRSVSVSYAGRIYGVYALDKFCERFLELISDLGSGLAYILVDGQERLSTPFGKVQTS